MQTATLLLQTGLGLCLGLAALGSALGIGAAGQAAAGAWAREGKEGRPLAFPYVILVGLPLSQTIYAFVLMLVGLRGAYLDGPAEQAGLLFGVGLGCGLGQLGSAAMQGQIGAAVIRAMVETQGKPLVFGLIAMGIAETVGLFSFVFLLLMLP